MIKNVKINYIHNLINFVKTKKLNKKTLKQFSHLK